MAPKFFPKPGENDEELPVTLTKDELDHITFVIDRLINDGGFDTWHAGRLATIGHLDWREAVKLRRRGCPQNLVYELLS